MSGGLQITGLHKAFGTQSVLRGLDLEVPEGSLTAILGSSGSGKTTLLRILAGFERPDQGSITIGGRIVDGTRVHLAPQHRGVGYVPQEGALFPHLSVAANIGFGLPRRSRRARVAELLALTGLAELAQRYPHQLSGGQQQRVALARALAPGPKLMLLDEPFSSLDASLRASVRSEVAEVLAAAGTTALLVTHDQDEALSLADQVAVLSHGRFAQCGSPDEIYGRPADPEVAAFVGEANLLRGWAEGGSARTALGRLALAAPVPAGARRLLVLVRPEQIEFTETQGAAGGPLISGAPAGDAGEPGGHPTDGGLGAGGAAGVGAAGVGAGGAAGLGAGGLGAAGLGAAGLGAGGLGTAGLGAAGGDEGVAGPGGGVRGVVRHCEYHGHDSVFVVDVEPEPTVGGGDRFGPPPPTTSVQVRVSGKSRLRAGRSVVLRVQGTAVAWPDGDRPGAVTAH